jgi:hypothetical protein
MFTVTGIMDNDHVPSGATTRSSVTPFTLGLALWVTRPRKQEVAHRP